MTLKEKLFNAIFDKAWEFKTEDIVPECEQIADELAVEFGKYLNNKVISTKGIHHHLSGKFYTSELYIIFKKEKGLI